ncbi:hypothetical protein COU74_01420 [Candidatus Peregrinibacteria bacterium CG10_big_fil_rev_8_21_14_0_10_36_19]|nr:MAG: hypothetical protein COU74_01420 [Candidatus Peregrinibacteria bacterium CG10_big_fil_rev_8_21_14_0_10_36_19]
MDKLIYYLIIVILIKIALSEVFNKIEINTKQKTIILNYTFSTKTIPINEIKKWGIRNRWQNKSFYTQSIEIRLKSGEIIGYPLSGLEFSQNTTKNENYFAKHIGIKPTKLKTYKFRLLPGTWSYFWL